METINELRDKLNAQHPGLSDFKFVIAVNREIVHDNIRLNGDEELALLPPFSGG